MKTHADENEFENEVQWLRKDRLGMKHCAWVNAQKRAKAYLKDRNHEVFFFCNLQIKYLLLWWGYNGVNVNKDNDKDKDDYEDEGGGWS